MTRFSIFLSSAILLLSMACSKEEGTTDRPDDTPTPPEAKTVITAGETVKVMTYNIHHANPPARPGVIGVNAIAGVINRERPDIVALQEVDVRTHRSGVGLDQAQTLAARTGMHVFFTKSIDFQGGEYGNAVLSRYPIVAQARHELPVRTGSDAERRSLAVIAVGTADGGRVYFGSTHLDVSDTDSRNMQVDRVRAVNVELNAPFILGGDFNAQIGSETLNRFMADNMFRVGCIGGCPNTIPVNNPNRAIDFVFLNGAAARDFTVQRYATVSETTASDHLPVVMEVKYK